MNPAGAGDGIVHFAWFAPAPTPDKTGKYLHQRQAETAPVYRMETQHPNGPAQQVWLASLGRLQLQVARPSYDTWLKGTVGISLQDGCLTVGVPTPFVAEWLDKRMAQLIQRTAAEVAASPLQVFFQVIGQSGATEPSVAPDLREFPPTAMTLPAQRPALSEDVTAPVRPLNNRYSFSNFVVGVTNRLAFAAACAVAEHPGEQYNPLFIYSEAGLGKTHLLHAIATEVAQRDLVPLYATCEQFTNDFVGAIRERRTEEFRTKYRSVDVLLLDDVQFLQGKEQTQESFFHTFNDLHNSNRQIVLACDRPLSSVDALEPRLTSRFSWGLMADIQAPDIETRVAILQSKATSAGEVLSGDLALLMAEQVQTNIRALEGCLNRVIALSRFTEVPITEDLIRIVLANGATPKAAKGVTPTEVLERIANYYSVSLDEIRTRSSARKTSEPQRVAMYLLSRLLRLPHAEIAQVLGNWNKKTVTNSVSSVSAQVVTDERLQKATKDLTTILQPR